MRKLPEVTTLTVGSALIFEENDMVYVGDTLYKVESVRCTTLNVSKPSFYALVWWQAKRIVFKFTRMLESWRGAL